MFYKAAIAAAAIAVASTPVFAQSFTGGELGIEYNTFVDDFDIDGVSYNGAVEFGINRNIGFGLDVDKFDIGEGGSDPRVTLHGIYHLSNQASVGAFYSESPGVDVNNASFGIEGGTALFGGDVGGYIGSQEVGDEDVLIFGLDSKTPVFSQFSVFTDFDLVGNNDIAAATSELGVSYQMQNGPEFYGQYGRLSAATGGGSVSTDYIGIGARITFGAHRGTTFEGR